VRKVQPDKAPPTCGPAGPAKKPRPSGERGSGWLEKKEWAVAGPKAEENYFRIKFEFLNIQRL
jgi:hypothetical protein